MKKMVEKKYRINGVIVIVLFLLGGLMTACTDYQDEIDSLDRRVATLEELMKRANSQIEAMTVLVNGLKDADYITDVIETDEGYMVKFKKNGPVYLYNGKDGKDGKDAQMPDIDVAKDDDGNYYWIIDGKPLTDKDGKPVRVNGKDGKDGVDGKDGKDGKDAIAPKVRIDPVTLVWEISTDGGDTWQPTGTSARGKDGRNGNQFFESVNYEITSEGEWMIVITKSGQTLRIPIFKNA